MSLKVFGSFFFSFGALANNFLVVRFSRFLFFSEITNRYITLRGITQYKTFFPSLVCYQVKNVYETRSRFDICSIFLFFLFFHVHHCLACSSRFGDISLNQWNLINLCHSLPIFHPLFFFEFLKLQSICFAGDIDNGKFVPHRIIESNQFSNIIWMAK